MSEVFRAHEESADWTGWRDRTVSTVEAIALAAGVDPDRLPPREGFGVLGDLSPFLVAQRLDQFLEKHPEVSAAARLELCRLLPFRRHRFPADAEEVVALVQHAKATADPPSGQAPLVEGANRERVGHGGRSDRLPPGSAESLLAPEDAQLLREAIAADRAPVWEGVDA